MAISSVVAMLLLLVGRHPASAQIRGLRVAAYVPDYRFGLDWESVGARTSDLLLFSVEPAADGSVGALERLPTSALEGARAARERHGTRIHVCVGGAGRSRHFGAVVQSPDARKKFGMGLLALAQVEKLDGIDIDWEGHIDPAADKGLGKMIRGLKKAAAKLYACPALPLPPALSHAD